MPPCAGLLAFDIVEADVGNGRARISFVAGPEFCNAAGTVQGGFLTAMLDDCMGPAILITTNAQVFPSTISLNVQFLAPAKLGAFIGTGRVLQLGTTIGFVEAQLEDETGQIVARATANVRLVAIAKAVPVGGG
jgi:uncharacterized protein (TIGR00369 family)